MKKRPAKKKAMVRVRISTPGGLVLFDYAMDYSDRMECHRLAESMPDIIKAHQMIKVEPLSDYFK